MCCVYTASRYKAPFGSGFLHDFVEHPPVDQQRVALLIKKASDSNARNLKALVGMLDKIMKEHLGGSTIVRALSCTALPCFTPPCLVSRCAFPCLIHETQSVKNIEICKYFWRCWVAQRKRGGPTAHRSPD